MTDIPSFPSARPVPAAPIVPPDEIHLARAAEILRAGGLVAIPTETVYGLAADATNGRAVARIYEAKGRPQFNPLICHVDSIEMANRCAQISLLAHALIERFWPGPLTLVLPRATTCPVSDLVSAGLDTIAVRMPKSPAAIELIQRLGQPLAAPSANPSEHLSPTTAQHVASNMADRIDLIIDGGPCVAGIESTIIAPTTSGCILLRPGALSRTEIETITGPLLSPDDPNHIQAPGMLRRHYAPRATLRLNASDQHSGEAFLAFGTPPTGITPTANLSPDANLEEAAANLFAMLHQLDAQHDAIAIAAIPKTGLGESINDRLKRAGARSQKDGV